MYCTKPDRDVPKIVCGYPLPCPHHTVILDLTVAPAKVTLPAAGASVTLPARMAPGRIGEIARALSLSEEFDAPVPKKPKRKKAKKVKK